MPRFSVDPYDVVLALLRTDLPDVTVMSRIPDHITDYLPLVVISNVGGDSPAPEFYDGPWFNVQCWCKDTADADGYRLASNLADDVRRILWTAQRTQRVIPGLGWINYIRESSGPRPISDVDRPFVGRYAATYELRVRPAA